MSKGLGSVERVIRDLFDANPDKAFSTDDLSAACYHLGLAAKVHRKHRGAVVRAAVKLVSSDPDWRVLRSRGHGRMLIYFNAASVMSMARACCWRRGADDDAHRRQTSSQLERRREHYEECVRRHIERRDADPEQRERVLAQEEAETKAKQQVCEANGTEQLL